ncbi:DUF5675 family protein [Tunicatimonas pelagia]|uniref:DUF5675 family protein n=1 Tax=Tunicatimonas pelagia TaxID=931531 RepID=UPI00266506A0|nr:DUF5675 family protein [Tunicatimonas pelagia]WKN43031.1 DUF5675 family protein [Tunicatimonas pelagia]
MKHVAALLFVALLTTVILLFLANPTLLEEIWLWIIGFIGYVILLLEKGFKAIVASVNPQSNRTKSLSTVTSPSLAIDNPLSQRVVELERKLEQEERVNNLASGSIMTVLRYLDDGHTSLGLIFLNKKFFAYTLEDTHQPEKVAGKTRIPSGTYQIEYRKQDTPLTESYRQRFPWFTYHLELKDVPSFKNIYIHIGNTHTDTDGCLLIADGVNASSSHKMITDSRLAFERLYKKISALLQIKEAVTIRIVDEDWFEQFQPQAI